MQKEILAELKALRLAVATLAGTADLPEGEQLNTAALEKAAAAFKKLTSARKAWVEEYQLSSIFKEVRYGSGNSCGRNWALRTISCMGGVIFITGRPCWRWPGN